MNVRRIGHIGNMQSGCDDGSAKIIQLDKRNADRRPLHSVSARYMPGIPTLTLIAPGPEA
jgi:hypothetical protein